MQPVHQRSRVIRQAPVALLLTWCVLGALLLCLPDTTVLNPRPIQNDFFAPIPGAWALACGLKIHTDLSSAMGLAYFLPYLTALKLFGPTMQIVKQGNAIIFITVSILAFLMLKPPRFSWTICALGVMLGSLLAANPVYFGESPMVISMGTVNWPAISLSGLCLLVPLSKVRKISDAILLAVILACLTFYKLNFLLVGSGFILLGLWTAPRISGSSSLKFLAWLAGFYLLFASAFVGWFRIDLAAMFRDIHMAACARSEYMFSLVPEKDFWGVSHFGWASVGCHMARAIKSNCIELSLMGIVLFRMKRWEPVLLAAGVW